MRGTWDERTEISATAQVGGWIYLLFLAEVGIPALCKFGLRAGGVAAVAITHDIDVVAAEADEGNVLASRIEGNRRGIQANLYARVATAVFCFSAGRDCG